MSTRHGRCARAGQPAGEPGGAAGRPPAREAPRVVLSNGFGRFPLRVAAVEAQRRGVLAGFITGGYPTPAIARCIHAAGLGRSGATGRLLARGAPLPAERIHALWAGEPLQQAASRLRRTSAASARAADRLDLAARRLYAAAAARIVAKLGPARGCGVYHYRSGFGGDSVAVARRHGWVCLCEHSIAHPATLRHLIDHQGRLPPCDGPGLVDRNWRAILTDVERADHVLVNSDFVKSTFLHMAWRESRISIIYRGVDDAFLATVPARVPNDGPMRVLFAGSFCRRKGGPVLAEAMERIGDVEWRLDLCGPVAGDAAASFARLTRDRRVTAHGQLSEPEVAARMASADVFAFPTLAEGSARVVFEALAAGCYVVTTPNAGSILADGVHGRLIAAGSAAELADALREAARDRARTARIGARAAALVRRSYRQNDYGERLLALYRHLLGD